MNSMTATTDLVDRLVEHRTLGAAPRTELEWLAAHGRLEELETGDVLRSSGESVDALYVILTGHLAVFVNRGAGRQRLLSRGAGDVTGALPYSRLTTAPVEVVAEEPTALLRVEQEHFRSLIRECEDVTTRLVHAMLDRARDYNSSELHDEKMVSLGRLAAGLAHELNNPAAAIERSALLLRERLQDANRAARVLAGSNLIQAQLAALDGAFESCLLTPVQGVRSPLEEVEREEEIAAWLANHELDTALAEPLSETAITMESLEQLASSVHGPALEAALRWSAAGCVVEGLAEEVQDAALRISGLVMAVKGFTHMDQAAVAQPVHLARGLDDTVAVLRSKARSKSVSVIVEVEPELPPVRGFAGELNQIWGNLIDNALDAVTDSGRVEVRAQRDGDRVIVRVIDNGEGIPEDAKSRIFDPFFTTKSVGQGTGLGLDIVRRLVLHNEGEIAVDSVPGATEFRVALPIARDGDGGVPS